GFVLLLVNRGRRRAGRPAVRNNAVEPAPYLPWLFLGFGLLWAFGTFVGTFGDYRHLKRALNEGRCQVIEGWISGYHAGSGDRGDADDTFQLGAIRFSMSDSTIGPGYQATERGGSPLRNGVHVRIWMDHGQIARLERLP
ncbi:MAG TPA: hypothetical protein VFM16_01935, partial [Holophagaceae bacterium]|nr:hypothetical protein [Holophagaceae bacterium]